MTLKTATRVVPIISSCYHMLLIYELDAINRTSGEKQNR